VFRNFSEGYFFLTCGKIRGLFLLTCSCILKYYKQQQTVVMEVIYYTFTLHPFNGLFWLWK